ncbi:MAG: translation initiation factor IF-3 [Endomicrobium sp.]|jgi:translation initiation factor IF-3|nr:translation initiation factor IF-3 [Endomicrobium sp.]
MSRGGAVENRKFRINQFIKEPEVRLIDSDGTMIGIFETAEALLKARAKGLDLVEISPQATPPVCKIINFSKFRYELKRKEKEIKKKQKVSHIKEVRIRPRISEHDLEVKIKRAREFIAGGDKVQFTFMFLGREIRHKDLIIKLLDKIKEFLTDVAVPEGRTSSLSSKIFLVFIPKKRVR